MVTDPIATKETGHSPYHAVSLSGGKDSTAMLILMVEKGMPIDAVFTADTGMEFPEMYGHLEKLDRFLYKRRKIHITTLHHPKGFEWLMFEQPKTKLSTIRRRLYNHLPLYGNGWPGIRVRWCTGELKTHLINRETAKLSECNAVVSHIGIAHDEQDRCDDRDYPLVDWGIAEEDALKICYAYGFDFGGLYEIYNRASCWCCPFQRIGGLRKLRAHHPDLWEKLLQLDQRARQQFGSDTPLGRFRQDWTVENLEKRFYLEERLGRVY